MKTIKTVALCFFFLSISADTIAKEEKQLNSTNAKVSSNETQFEFEKPNFPEEENKDLDNDMIHHSPTVNIKYVGEVYVSTLIWAPITILFLLSFVMFGVVMCWWMCKGKHMIDERIPESRSMDMDAKVFKANEEGSLNFPRVCHTFEEKPMDIPRIAQSIPRIEISGIQKFSLAR